VKIKVNKDLFGFKKGETFTIEDDKGIPLDSYWRKRLKDSEFDNCITVIEERKVKGTPTGVSKEKSEKKEWGDKL